MAVDRINFSSGVHWEPLRGYSRAVLAGDHLYISGTTAMTKGGNVAGQNAYDQTRHILQVVKSILSKSGFVLEDVVRTRLFVTSISSWEDYARAHREIFDHVRPASSIVQVAKLVDPRLLIEMEVDAVRGCHLIDTRAIEAAPH